MIDIKEYNGDVVNQIEEGALTALLYEMRGGRPFPADEPPKVKGYDIFQYITDHCLVAEYLRTFNKVYDRFGRVGACLVGYITILCNYDIIAE